MGFAAGLKAGQGLVQAVMDNERQSRLDARADEEYARKKRLEGEQDEAAAAMPKYALNPVSPATPVAPGVTGNAPPTSVAATDATGVPPAPAAQPAAVGGVPTMPGGAAPTVAAGLQPPSAAPAAQAAPAAAAQAAAAPAPAAQPYSEDMNQARAMFNYARATRDVNGMRQAQEQIRTVAKRDYMNQAGKLNDGEALQYVNKNLNLAGGMPVSIAKTGKDGYTLMSWDEEGNAKVTMLNGAQVKQLVAADMMSKNGFADEGLQLAAGVHKDLNDLISKRNQSTQGQAQVNNQAAQGMETARHNRASEANAAARLGIERDKAEQSKKNDKLASMDIVASNKDGYVLMNKRGEREFVKYPEGVTQADFVKKYMPQGETAPKINADGSATYNGKLYEKDPKTNKWVEAAGFGPSALEKAWDAKYGDGAKPGAAPAAAPGAPAAAAPARTAIPPKPGTPAPADPTSPVEVAGARLDAARQAITVLRTQAPGLAKGNAAREAFAVQMQEAQAALAQAEKDYQQTLPGGLNAPAFSR